MARSVSRYKVFDFESEAPLHSLDKNGAICPILGMKSDEV